MTTYLITWYIELDADSAEEAAQKALEIQRDPDSTATVFDVQAEGGNSVCIVDVLELEPDCEDND